MRPSAPKRLVDLIARAVEEIEADTATRIPGGVTSDVNDPIVAREDELVITPQRTAAIRTLEAATHQLLATLIPAGLRIQQLYFGYLQTVAIDIVVRARIADLIDAIDRDSSQEGASLELLAAQAAIDPRKLSHILRFLALRNIFYEPSPNRWANNRGSLPLRTDSANTHCNLLGHLREEVALPALFELANALLDKDHGKAFSEDYRDSAFQRYFKPEANFFEFLSKSEGAQKATRFGHAMVEATKAYGDNAAPYRAYEWEKKLGTNGTLIDVGGGIGGAAYPICSYLPGWNLVVQDRPEVIKAGKENYQRIKSTAKIEFEKVDLFQEQPPHRVGGADAYFLRHILHDWPVESCVEILSHLRNAAKPTTRLLICEIGLEPPIVDPDSPILSNGGMASSMSYNLDLTMLILFNTKERSKEEFSEIFKASGWVFLEATPLPTVDHYIFEAVPNSAWTCCLQKDKNTKNFV